MSPGLAPTTKFHQITTRPRGCTRLPFDEAPNTRSTDTLEVVCLEGELTIEIASYLTKKRGEFFPTKRFKASGRDATTSQAQ